MFHIKDHVKIKDSNLHRVYYTSSSVVRKPRHAWDLSLAGG